jgi:hypothetical protein
MFRLNLSVVTMEYAEVINVSATLVSMMTSALVSITTV